MEEALLGAKKISERISVAQFRLNKTGNWKTKLCIVNVYGPTSMRQKEHSEETEIFNAQLRDTYSTYKNKNSIIIMAADLNDKLGLNSEGERFMGANGKRTRNESRERLASFLSIYSRAICN